MPGEIFLNIIVGDTGEVRMATFAADSEGGIINPVSLAKMAELVRQGYVVRMTSVNVACTNFELFPLGATVPQRRP